MAIVVESGSVKLAYSPDQPRDDHGRFDSGSTSGGGGDVREQVAHTLANVKDVDVRGNDAETLGQITRLRAQLEKEDPQLTTAARVWSDDSHYISTDADAILSGREPEARMRPEQTDVDVQDARTLLDAVSKSPPADQELYRGLRITPDHVDEATAEFAVGNHVDMALGSLSSDMGIAQNWASGNFGVQMDNTFPILMRFEPGEPALHLAPISLVPEEQEWVSSGHFAVSDSKPYTDYHGNVGIHVTMHYDGALTPVKAAATTKTFTYERPPQWLVEQLNTSFAEGRAKSKRAYAEDQPRDDHGRFSTDGSYAYSAEVHSTVKDWVYNSETTAKVRTDAEALDAGAKLKEDEYVHDAHVLMSAVEQAPLSDHTLYRGIGVAMTLDQARQSFAVGNQFHIPLGSFSRSQDEAQKFGQWGQDQQHYDQNAEKTAADVDVQRVNEDSTLVMFQIDGGAHALDLSKIEDKTGITDAFFTNEAEEIVRGDFEVTGASSAMVQDYYEKQGGRDPEDPQPERSILTVTLKPVTT